MSVDTVKIIQWNHTLLYKVKTIQITHDLSIDAL